MLILQGEANFVRADASETVFRFAPICSLVANAKSRAYYSFSRSQVQTSLPQRGGRIRRLVPNCWAREQHLLLLEEPTEMSCGEGGCRRLGCDVFIFMIHMQFVIRT